MAGRTELRVPDLGDFTDVEVIEVLVSGGDTVEVEDALVAVHKLPDDGQAKTAATLAARA